MKWAIEKRHREHGDTWWFPVYEFDAPNLADALVAAREWVGARVRAEGASQVRQGAQGAGAVRLVSLDACREIEWERKVNRIEEVSAEFTVTSAGRRE